MFARWDRMVKQFSRISKEIIVAVKAGGADPHANPALRRAVQNARQINMPKDKVEAAIKRAAGKDATSYETIIYEGYAPHGVAVIVEAATDNPTRTVASVHRSSESTAATSAAPAASRFNFARWACFAESERYRP
jgi:YebC/PmpR family DNA-binding regulatory protein